MRGHQADFGHGSREIARQLYRAAVQPNPLTSWGKILTDHLQSYSSFTLLGPAGRVIDIGAGGAHDPDRKDYIERYQFINPLNRFWETAPQGKVIHFDHYLIDEECRGSEFYARYGHFLGPRDGVCMLLRIGGTQKVLVNVLLPRHAREAERLKALFADLSEDLQLALEIAGAYLEASNTVGSVIDSLDQEGVGVAILSGDGRIRNASHRMAALLQDDRGLRAEVQGAMVRPPARRSGGGRSSPRRMAVYPTGQGADDAVHGAGKIIVFLADAGDRRIDLTQHLRDDYGLTPAEARVAERLRDGRTSSQIAAEFGVQANCVRSHLKSIFAKTGTHSQVALLNFLQQENDVRLAEMPRADRRASKPLNS